MASGGINTGILSDETFDLLCTVCKRKGRNREADHFCINCQDYYCSGCVKVHEDIPLLSGHNIRNKGQFPSRSTTKRPAQPRGQGSSQAVQLAPTEICDRHSHYFIDTYCQNHDTVGCATCMTIDHRSCQDIFYIPEFVKNNASESKEIKKKLEYTAKALTECHENFQREKRELLKGKAESLKSIRQFRKEINDRLDELEKLSVDKIEDKYDALINQTEKILTKLQQNRTKVTSARDKLASTGQNPSQTFVNAKRGSKIQTTADKCMVDEKARKREGNVEFKGEQKLISLLEQMAGLGGVTCVNEMHAQHLEDVGRQRTPRHATGQEYYTAGKLNKESLLQIQGKKSYSVTIKTDTLDCNIISACMLENGTIILSDRNNKKLKRLDSTTYNITGYYDLPVAPWQVCVIDKQEVAVCLDERNEIHFISVSGRMTTTRKINTDFKCYGIAYAKGNLYISDSSESVYIYSMSGQKLKQFSKDQSGQRLFSNIRHLAVSEDASMIYVVDWDKRLIVMNNNGQVVSTLNGPQLQNGTGCYLTRTGSLLVCGSVSSNVLQFGYNGELIGEVYKSLTRERCQTVCTNQQMTKVILGTYCKNTLGVYDLK